MTDLIDRLYKNDIREKYEACKSAPGTNSPGWRLLESLTKFLLGEPIKPMNIVDEWLGASQFEAKYPSIKKGELLKFIRYGNPVFKVCFKEVRPKDYVFNTVAVFRYIDTHKKAHCKIYAGLVRNNFYGVDIHAKDS